MAAAEPPRAAAAAAAAAAEPGPCVVFVPAPKTEGRCHHFDKKGFCNLAERCKFVHERPDDDPTWAQRQPKRRAGASHQDEPVALAEPAPAAAAVPPAVGYYLLNRVHEHDDRGSLLRRTLECNGFRLTRELRLCDVIWGKRFPKQAELDQLKPSAWMLHYPRHTDLTHKIGLAEHLSRAQSEQPQKYAFFPRSFILPRDRQVWAAELASAQESESAAWIIKPPRSGEGRGIRIVAALSPDDPAWGSELVVSRYVTNPMLIGGKKFDLRLYVVVLSLDPLVVYLYDQGIVRFAAEDYSHDPASYGNLFAHLTNNTVSKKKQRFLKHGYEQAFMNNWSFDALRQHLDTSAAGGRKDETKEHGRWASVWQQVRHMVGATIEACAPSMLRAFREATKAVPHPCKVFELFGFDALLDEFGKVFLLEVNSMPDLSTSGSNFRKIFALHHQVKSHMLAHLLTLLQFPVHGPETAPPAKWPLRVGGFERVV